MRSRILALVCLLLFALPAIAQTYSLSPVAHQQFFDSNGKPLAGGMLYTYLAGTTTLATTYTSSTGTANTNPIVLNSGGYTPSGFYLDPALQYKFRLTNSLGVQQWTQDNISPAGGTAGGAFDPHSPPPIGDVAANTINCTVCTASTRFSGPLTGNVTGNVAGNLTGNVTGNVSGNVTGNVNGRIGVTTPSDATFTTVNVTGTLTAATLAGNLNGNVTGSLTGNVTGNVTGNADTATTATKANALVGFKSFDAGGTCSTSSADHAVCPGSFTIPGTPYTNSLTWQIVCSGGNGLGFAQFVYIQPTSGSAFAYQITNGDSAQVSQFNHVFCMTFGS